MSPITSFWKHLISNTIYLKTGIFGVALLSFVLANAQNSTTISSAPNDESATLSSLETNGGSQTMVFSFTLYTAPNGEADFEFTALNVDIVDNTIDWSQVIAGATLRSVSSSGGSGDDGVVVHGGGVNITATQIQFTSIDNANDQIGEVDDSGSGETKIYEILIHLSTSIPSGIASQLEGKFLELTIDQSSFTIAQNSFNGAQSGSSGATNNELTVVATEYRFVDQPSATVANSVMTPAVTIEATDVNGVRDLDHSAADAMDVTSDGTMTGDPLSPSWSSGLATLPNIVHTAAATGRVLTTQNGDQFAGGNATSSTFDITADNVAPTMSSAVDNGTTQIDLTFSEIVANNSATAGDFTVTDGIGGTFTVSAIADATPGDEQIELTVADFSGATGDLTVTYSQTSGTIDDLATNPLANDAVGVVVDLDNTAPQMSSAVNVGNTQIDVTFDEPVQINSATAGDFTVTDGIGGTFTVTAIADGTGQDTDLELTVNNFSGATGDLTVTYAQSSGTVDDFGSNSLADDAVGVVVNFDNTAPQMSSAVNVGNTQIDVTFDEVVQINSATAGDFTVTDGIGGTFTVTGIADGTGQDTDIELTVNNFSTAVGDLTVTYSQSSGTIDDFGGNSLANDAVGVSINFDNTAPQMSSATNVGNTQIDVTFDEPVQINSATAGDFTVTDGIGGTFTVTALADGTGQDTDIELTVNNFSGATGDLTVTYSQSGGSIDDFGGNSLANDAVGVVVNFDNTAPQMSSAVNVGNTQIDVTFDEIVQINSAAAGDFTVTDGIGGTFTVTAIADGTGQDTDIELTVNNFSTAVGDLTVTYSQSSGTIDDFGGNSLANDAVGVVVNFDNTAPQMSSATNVGNTQIDVTFDEPVQINSATPGDFTVTDGIGGTFTVTAIADGTGQDTDVELTVNNFSGATGDLTVTYAQSGGSIDDFGGNSLADDAVGVTIDFDNTAPQADITRLTPTNQNTNLTSVQFDVDFGEQVQNVDLADFTIAAGGANGSLVSVTGGPTNYTVTINTISEAGTDVLDLDFAGGVSIDDFGGNAFAGAIGTEETFIIDQTVPTITDINLLDTDVDGFIDRIDVVFDDNVDTDDSAVPVIGDFGNLILPDGTAVTGGTFSDPAGASNTVQITNITDQVTATTGLGIAEINTMVAGAWVDDAGNAILATGADSETVNDDAPPVITDVAFYDDAGADGLIDRIVLTWSEPTSATDATLDANELTGFVTLPDGSAATFGSAVFGGDGTASMNITGITGQVTPATSVRNTAADNDPITFDINGITGQFTDGTNPTVNPDDNETYTDNADPILVDSTPANGSTVGVGTNLILEFSERVAAGSGNVTITDESNGTDTQMFAIGVATIDSTTVFFNPSDLSNAENYSVQIANTAVEDLATVANVYGGISNNFTLIFSTVATSPLVAGDVAFVGYNSDDDELALVVLVDIFGAITPQEIRITDEEWEGVNTRFESTQNNDGDVIWTINVNIAAGTVVEFTNLNGTPAITAGMGSIATGLGGMDIQNGNEAVFAFVGTGLTAVSAVLTGMATDNTDAGAWGDEGLTNSGLTEGTNAIAFNSLDVDLDGANYQGPRSGENSFDDYKSSLFNPIGANWQTADGGTANPAFNLTAFTIDDNDPLIASIEYNTPAGTPTNADALIWDVTFSDLIDGGAAGTSVTNVDAADFAVSGGTTATVTNVTGGPLAYQVTVSGGDLAGFNGTVTLGFAGGQNIQDGAGNILDDVGSTPSPNENAYVVDNDPPGFGTNSISGATIGGFDINTQLDELGDVYWVVVADGAIAPSVAQVVAGQDNTGAAAIASGTINIDMVLATRTGTPSGLASNTPFDVYIVGVDESGNQMAAVTLLNAATTAPDVTSDISFAGAFGGGFDYTDANYQLNDIADVLGGEGLAIGRLRIRDNGSGDNSPTILENLSLEITGHANLRRIALFERGTNNEIGEIAVSGSTANFTGLSFSVADGTQEDVDVYVTFLANVTDNDNVFFTVNDDANTSVAAVGSSDFVTPIDASLSNSDTQTITVTATNYAFAVDASDVTVDVAMSPAVQIEAVDALGSRDLDYTAAATITSDGTLSGASVNVSINTGIGTAGSVIHTVAQAGRTLTVSGALVSDNSVTFTVRPLDTDTDATLVTGGETSNIDYAANQQTDLTAVTGVSLATIDITDAGTQDQIATILTDLQLSITNDTYLRQLALYDDLNNELAEITVSGSTANFSGMSFNIPDGTTESITLRGSFTTSVVDNTKVSFTLTSATAQATASSNFTGGTVSGTSSTGGTDNQIEVIATRLYFSAIEAQSFVNEAFAATIQSVDNNLVQDLDYSSSLTLTAELGGGVLSGTTTPSLSSGEVTVSDLAINAVNAHNVRATDGSLIDGIGAINITTPDTDTQLADGPLDETAIVINATDDADPGIPVYDFRISDAGTSDAAPTLVTQINIRQGAGTSVAIDDWTEVFAGARLVDSDGNQHDATAINATSIEFGSMPIGSMDIGEVLDGGIKTYTLRVWTQTTFGGSVADVFDGKFVEFVVDDTDITTSPSGSAMDVANIERTSGAIDTEVQATELAIASFPANIYLDFDFTISVEAIDANGNLDLDESSPVTITTIGASPGGVTSVTGTANQPLSNGVYTWTDLQVTDAGTFQFQIDDALVPVISLVQSGTIPTSDPDNTSLLDRVAGEQTTQIEYINFQGAVASMNTSNSEEVLTFMITDAGGDGIPTIVNSIDVDELSGNDAMLRGIAIFDGSTRLGSVTAGATNTIPLSPAISITDGGNATFSVRVSFETGVTDNTQFEFDVSDVLQPATAASTIQGSNINATSTTGANDNTINVTATTITVLSIDNPVIVGQNFTATAEARDGNNNLDEDFTSTVTASTSVGPGDIDTSGGNDQATTSDGTYDFSNSLRLINGGGVHTILFDAGSGVTGTAIITAIYNTSDIIVDPGFTHPTFINYIQYSEATILFASSSSLDVARFLVRDGAGSDTDGLSTFVTSVRVDLDADAQDNVTNLALFDDSGNQISTQQTVAGSTVTFNIPMPYLEVADGTTFELRLKATFDQAANINDGEQMQFSIGQITDNDGGNTESDIADNTPTGIQTPVGADENTIDVIGDRIVYTTDPGSTLYERNSANINFDIEARDGVGNLDTDETSVLNISGTSALGGAAAILNGTTVTLSGGTASKTIQVDNEHEDMTLTVSDPGAAGSRTGTTTLSTAGVTTLIDVYDTTDPIIVSKSADLEPDDGAVDVTISSINSEGLRLIFSEEVSVNPAGGNIVVEGDTSPITEQIILDILTDVVINPDGDNPNEVELTMPGPLTSGVQYYVIIPANTFRDDPNNNININGGGGVDDVNDFAGYLADTDWSWTMENVLTVVDATYTPTTITLEFNIPVQISGTAANVVPYFTLTDQSGAGSAQSLLGATLTDGTGGDEFLELNVDLSGALGDVEITYSDPSPGVADGISQDGNTTVELGDLTAGSGPILNLDNTIPTLFSAAEISTTDITLTFSEAVQIDTEIATDFVVTDGLGNNYPVTNWNDATPDDDELELVVTNFAAAVGDLTITYTRTTSRIEDYGGNGLVTGQVAGIDRDVTIPTYTSATADPMVDPNRITMNFSEDVQTNGINLLDFSVVDGAFNNYEVFVQSASGSTVLLTTADFSGALGDLTVTYTNNNNEIRDYGGNVVGTSNQNIVLDAVSPSMIDASKTTSTTITVTFDEDVQLLDGAGTTTGFTVVDEQGNPFTITGQSVGGDATEVVITTSGDFDLSVGDLLVSFADPGALQDQVSDFSNNLASPVGPLTIDLAYNESPTLTENALPLGSDDDYEPNDMLGDALAMFRTNGTADPSTRTPVNVRPVLNGSTITVYRDAGLTLIAHQEVGVSNTLGYDVTVAELLNGTAAIDFTGIDDNGTYTFYITETSQNGVTAEGPAVTYSVAFLDEIANTEGTTTFNENGGDVVGLSVEHPTGQLIQFSGNALSNLVKNPGATTTIDFLVDAATTGVNQIELSWENSSSLVEATFTPLDLQFTVNASVEVFSSPTSDRAFGRNEGINTLDINNALGTFDVGEVSGQTAAVNFYNIEAYYIVNGSIDASIGVPGRANAAGGNIASTILTYDGLTSNGGTNHGGAITAGLPSYIDGDQPGLPGEWQFTPTQLPVALGGPSTQEVDTVRLYTISQSDIPILSQGIIFFDEIYIYPDPTVTLTNLSSFYCEDEDPIAIESRIVTYVGDGGIDSTGVVSNGYLLTYYGADNTYTTPVSNTNFSGATINGVVPSGTITSIFDPSDPNQDADGVAGDETGYYRITYVSEGQTAALTTAQTSFDFEVRLIESRPVIDLTGGLDLTGGVNDNGTAGDVSDDYYVFEFCSGVDVIPNITIDVVASPSDPNASLVPNSSYNWYTSNGTLIVDETNSLDPLNLFASNPPAGTVQQDIYVTRVVNGCESDSVAISIRAYAVPQTPTISVAETVANDGNSDGTDEVNVAEDGGDYFFEYCSPASATITYDDLLITSSLEDIPADRAFVENRTYFRIYDADAVTPLFVLTNTGGPYNIDLNTRPELAISNTADATADGVVLREFYISKVVADSTFTDAVNGDFAGCESELTKVTTAIYTYPIVPVDFTGNPRDDSGIINYYMCAGEDFPDMGVNPAATATFGETQFEWFSDAALTNLITTTNRRGEVVSQSDLEGHLGGADFDATVPNVYTYWVRFRSNINENSGFAGCESDVQQVNLTVFPQSIVPTVAVTSSELLSTVTDPAIIGNFDVQYNFCVVGGAGLESTTEFSNFVNYPGTPNSGENEMLWFTANSDGDAVISSNPITSGDDSTDPGRTFVVTAEDLQIQSSENQVFNFAVIHRADFFSGYSGFSGCFSDATDTTFVQVVVSTIPETQFTYSGITAGEVTSFDFIDDNSVGSNVDISFELRRASDNSLVTTALTDNRDVSVLNPDYQFTFTDPGVYNGILSITSSAGCELTTTRQFQILEKIQVSSGYFESFDGTNGGGWVAEFQSDDGLAGSIGDTARRTSWEHGFPDGENINTTRSGGGQAWATTGNVIGSSFNNTYVGGEVSYVYSPAFDISTLTNPAIRFSTYRDLDGTKDGVVFQYSIDDGVSWSTLGDFDITNAGSPSSGQNWYNESAISTSPGDAAINSGSGYNPRRVGWAGQYTAEELIDVTLVNNWFESTHELSEIPFAGRDNVRFRFALSASGAIGDDKVGDGFAFDDMQIFQLGKNVLIEQFSSAISAPSIIVGQAVNNLAGTTLMINYFTSVANTETNVDEINVRNTTGPGARRAMYGIGEVPTTVLDGEVITPSTNGQGVINGPGWDDNDLSIKGLAPAFFTMPLGNGVNEFGVRQDASAPGTIAVTAQFQPQIDTINRDYSFIFAVVEPAVDATNIGDYSNAGINVIRNVLRIFLPSPAGFNYKGNVTAGTPFEYSVDWDINNVYDDANLRVIAFVQDNETKTVLQAGYVDLVGTAENILGINGIADFSVYPNPADDIVTVEFDEASKVDSDWILFDQTGREVFKGQLEKGTKSLSIETKELPSGLYFFNMYNGEEVTRARRIIVTH